MSMILQLLFLSGLTLGAQIVPLLQELDTYEIKGVHEVFPLNPMFHGIEDRGEENVPQIDDPLDVDTDLHEVEDDLSDVFTDPLLVPPPVAPKPMETRGTNQPPLVPKEIGSNPTLSAMSKKMPPQAGPGFGSDTMSGWYQDGDCLVKDLDENDADDPHLDEAFNPFAGTRFSMERIIGGEETDVNEFPWVVSLQTSQGQHFCGGSIISNQIILTAAHCLTWGVKSVQIAFGEHHLHQDSESESFTRRATKLIIHDQHVERNPDFDIGLIKLDTPISFEKHIKSIRIPSQRTRSLTGGMAIASGWGNTEWLGGEGSSTLQKVSIGVISNEVCQEKYKDDTISERMMCAGVSKGGKDSCQGDSGGPLIMKGRLLGYVQVGIVSWGRGCGFAQYPGVYTRISKFSDWIRTNAEK